MDYSWFTKFFCPIAGLIITNVMWLSPLSTILKSRGQTTPMQEINPTPFSFMILNCIGWVIYALMIDNLYIFFANMSGVALGLFYLLSVMMSAVRHAPLKGPSVPVLWSQLERQLLCAVMLWIMLSLASTSSLAQKLFHTDGEDLERLVIGNTVMIFNVAYYAAPFSTLVKVVRSRDSSSILAVMVSANLLDAGLWLVYAGAINDWYLLVPNALGVFLAVSQLTVRLIYFGKGPTYTELASSTAVFVEDLTPAAEHIPSIVAADSSSGVPFSGSTAFVDSTTVIVDSPGNTRDRSREWHV